MISQTGIVHGGPRASLSITFGGVRRGHLLARDEVGAIVVVDIGHPPAEPAWPSLVTDPQAAQWLRRLRSRDHKGERGRVVIVGGDAGMSGAVRMAGRAAFAAGAGLVHVVAPPETVAALTQAEPDLQTLAHPLERASRRAVARSDRARGCRGDRPRAGPRGRTPGAGDGPDRRGQGGRAGRRRARRLSRRGRGAAARSPRGARSCSRRIRASSARCFPALAPIRELDPWAAAVAAAEQSGATVLLKGVPTVIAAASGGAAHRRGRQSRARYRRQRRRAERPGRTALAHGLAPAVAAALGAQALGRAADLAARRSSARTLRPMDVVAALPDLWREWELYRLAPPLPRPPVLLELEAPQVV